MRSAATSSTTAAYSLPDHAELFDFLRATHGNKTRVGAIQERLRLLDRVDTTPTEQKELDKLRKAIDALRNWLRRPQHRSLVDRARSRRPWLLAAAMVVFGGVVLAEYVSDLFLSLAAFGAGFALAVLLVGEGRGIGSRRSDAQATFEELDLEGPGVWDVPKVQSSLLNLESDAAELAANIQRARDRSVERQSLKAELSGLREQQAELDSRRQALKTTLGLVDLPADAELVDFARTLDGLRLASAKHEAVRGKLKHLESTHTDQLSTLAAILESHGEPRPENAAAAKARLNALGNRNSQFEQGAADERRAQRQLAQNAEDRETTNNAVRRLYADAGLDEGDIHGLASLLQALPAYRKLTGEVAALESQNELDRSALEEANEVSLVESDAESLERLKAQLDHAAAQSRCVEREGC